MNHPGLDCVQCVMLDVRRVVQSRDQPVKETSSSGQGDRLPDGNQSHVNPSLVPCIFWHHLPIVSLKHI